MPAPGEGGPALDAFLDECRREAESVIEEFREEWEREMGLALGSTKSEAPPATDDPAPP
jgi:hypothetical protein